MISSLLELLIAAKNVTKRGKSPKVGGAVSIKNQKVQTPKFGLYDKRRGAYIFIFIRLIGLSKSSWPSE